MNSPFDILLFNTKLVTAALLLLNFLFLSSLYLCVKWARAPKGRSSNFGKRQQSIIFGMLVSVIGLNGLAVYGNNALRKATESLIDELAGASFAAPAQVEEAKEPAPDMKKEEKLPVKKDSTFALKEA